MYDFTFDPEDMGPESTVLCKIEYVRIAYIKSTESDTYELAATNAGIQLLFVDGKYGIRVYMPVANKELAKKLYQNVVNIRKPKFEQNMENVKGYEIESLGTFYPSVRAAFWNVISAALMITLTIFDLITIITLGFFIPNVPRFFDFVHNKRASATSPTKVIGMKTWLFVQKTSSLRHPIYTIGYGTKVQHAADSLNLVLDYWWYKIMPEFFEDAHLREEIINLIQMNKVETNE